METIPKVGSIETVCRVCGYDPEDLFWEGSNPTYLICDCCGAEAGVDDLNPKVARRSRSEWLAGGCPWFIPTMRPSMWNLSQQMARIRPDFV